MMSDDATKSLQEISLKISFSDEEFTAVFMVLLKQFTTSNYRSEDSRFTHFSLKTPGNVRLMKV